MGFDVSVGEGKVSGVGWVRNFDIPLQSLDAPF